MSQVHENDQDSQPSQQPDLLQSAAFLMDLYNTMIKTPPFSFDSNIQVPWISSGMPQLDDLPSPGYSDQTLDFQSLEQNKNEAESRAQLYQSYVSKNGDWNSMQPASIQLECAEKVSIPAAIDVSNAQTEIRSVNYAMYSIR